MGDAGGGDAEAGILTASIQGWIRGRAAAREPVSRTVRDLNRDVLEISNGHLYPSLFHANVHAERGEVQYVNAGYNHVLLYRRHARAAIVLERTGTVLGLSAKSRFEQRTVRAHGGDILVALTDGGADAMNEPALLEAVRKVSGESSRKLAEHLLRAAGASHPSVLAIRFLDIGREIFPCDTMLARAA
jgi:hypothetical protein